MSEKDKVFIANLMENFVSEVPEKPFLTICDVCAKGVIQEEMKYVNGRVFHIECFERHGKNFPAINHDLLNRCRSAKIELVQLRNLKARTLGISNPDTTKSRPMTKKKSKLKTKRRRPKRRTVKRRRTTSKRRKMPRRSSRRTKRRIVRRPARKRKSRRLKSRTRRKASRRARRKRR